jgi:leucyl aminopeptidase (aminopeptidase T)
MGNKSAVRFGRFERISPRLTNAARVAVGEVLRAKKGERVLILTNPNPEVRLISEAIYDASLERGAVPTVLIQPAKSQLDFANDAVIHALRAEPEIAISVSHAKLGKDRFGMKKKYRHGKKSYDSIFHYLLGSKKTRGFWSPSVTVSMFQRTVPIDYKSLHRTSAKLKRAFDHAHEAHITTDLGTDLMIGLRGRKAFTDDGNFSKPGTGGNLPAGEMYISPELHTAEGTLVFDGCISSDRGVILIKEPIRVMVKRNTATEIAGGNEARQLKATLERARKTTRRFAAEGKISKKDLAGYLENIRNLGELGIGLNEKARIVGNMLEDEKVFRTCHIAIGSNYDGDAKALIHLDGLVRNPTIELRSGKGKPTLVMEKGRLVL